MKRTLRGVLSAILLIALQAYADGSAVSDNAGLVQGYKGAREGAAKRAVAEALISLKRRNYGDTIALSQLVTGDSVSRLASFNWLVGEAQQVPNGIKGNPSSRA